MEEPCVAVIRDSSIATSIEQDDDSNAVLLISSTAYTIGSMTKRRETTPEEKHEAARLRAIYEARKAAAKAAGGSLSQALVAEMCGWSNQSAFGHYITGRLPLNLEALLAIAKALEFDPSEVSPRLTVNMPSPSKQQESEPSNIGAGPEIKGRLPLISWVQAGDWCEAIDNFAPGDAEDWLPCPFDHSDTAFCLRVVGLSMSPDYREGEIIAVDPSVSAAHGSDVVCRTPEGSVTFKRLQITPDGTYLLAINPDWPNRMIAIPSETHVCGVVIGSWMKR